MIHLVCYSQSETQRQWLAEVFPPALSKVIFDKEKEFIDFIKNLKIPTQIILDLETFQYDLQAFLLKNDFHHTICFQKQYTYQKCMETLKHGALLVNHAQLSSLQWWWSRTTIVSSKMKVDQLPAQGIFAVLSPTDKQPVQSWSEILSEHCSQHSKNFMKISALACSNKLHLFEELRLEATDLSMIFIEDIDKIFPNSLRAMLLFLNTWSRQHNIQVVFNALSSQVLFESLLDWSTSDSKEGIYRLQFNRGRIATKSISASANPLFPHPITLEYVRYTWIKGQHIA